LFIVEAVFGSEVFLESSIAATVPICPAVPFLRKVNLLIFLGVLIVFLFKDVS
jgi:hypothetical protein